MKFKEAIKTTILVVFLLGAFLFIVYATTEVADAMGKSGTEVITTETEETETETEIGLNAKEIGLGMYEEDDYLYVICDVVELNEDTFCTVMPNGELHEYYMIEDYPIDDNGRPYFTLVCFKVAMENQEDYTKYEVVTVR